MIGASSDTSQPSNSKYSSSFKSLLTGGNATDKAEVAAGAHSKLRKVIVMKSKATMVLDTVAGSGGILGYR